MTTITTRRMAAAKIPSSTSVALLTVYLAQPIMAQPSNHLQLQRFRQ